MRRYMCPHVYNNRLLFGSHQAKKCLRICAKCGDLDHPARAHSIIRALLSIHIFCNILLADSECPDQTARICIYNTMSITQITVNVSVQQK